MNNLAKDSFLVSRRTGSGMPEDGEKLSGMSDHALVESRIAVVEYFWGSNVAKLSPPFDIIIMCEV